LRRYAPSQSPANNKIKPLVSVRVPEASDDTKRKRKSAPVTAIAKLDMSEFRSPYSTMALGKSSIDLIALKSSSEHDKIIQQLLNKPFKCPLPGYICKNSPLM
uniref:Uncharacterized protein n=1 Tax=Panagrolaimus sp. ES5 TaxID=591445 RepID=A0AC34GLZ9_9BILA